MKKIFTFALAAAAVISAGAANNVARNMELTTIGTTLELSTDRMDMMQSQFEASPVMSRADEDVLEIAGNYYWGNYNVITVDGVNALGEFIEPCNYWEIVADPEVENGYLVKGFLQNWWNEGANAEEQVEMPDIKATWDPEAQTLTFEAYPFLFTLPDEKGEMHDFYLIGAKRVGDNFSFDKDASIVLNYIQGRFIMDTSVCRAFMFGEINGQNISGMAYQFYGLSGFVPNGSLTGFSEIRSDEIDFPVLGIWLDGFIYVQGITYYDPMSYGAFRYNPAEGTISYDGLKYGAMGHLLQIASEKIAEQPFEYDYKLYAAEPDENGYPAGTGYDLTGTITSSTADEFTVEFPRFAFYTDQDEAFFDVEDGVLTFKPSTIAGIETIATANNNADAPVVYYNLQGVRVANPANGVFIRQQGTEATKVLVK